MRKVKLDVLDCFTKLTDCNVDYKKPSKERYHYCKDLNMFVGSCFSLGNLKLDATIAVTKLKEIFTCLDCKDCKKDCYGKKASIRPTVNNYRWIHTYMAINHTEEYKTWLIDDLRAIEDSVDYVRIHESGDFFAQYYLNMWIEVIKLFPNLKFYFYTKSENILDFSVMLTLPNVNRVKSHLPNGDVNFDDENIIKAKCSKYNVPLCPYGVNGNKEIHCGSKCHICMDSDCVGFVKH